MWLFQINLNTRECYTGDSGGIGDTRGQQPQAGDSHDTWRDEDGNEYDALPALPSSRIRASSPKSRGILNTDNSVITVQGNDKMEKMEENIQRMQKRLEELQQDQVNQSIGPRDLVNYMESSNSNLIDKFASQSKRARSPERKPEEPKLLDKTLELKDDAHSILQKEYRENWRQINRNPELWWSQGIYPTEVEPNLRGSVYLEHLIPMTLNEKAWSWLHSSSKRIDVKMMSHKN